MKEDHKRFTNYLFWTIAFFGFIYVTLRSFYIQVTHDEAFSFLLVDTNYLKAMISTANNHWLNSIFMKLFSTFFGNEMWMVRIHSVLSFSVISIFLFRIYSEIKLIGAKLLLIGLILLNPFFLEFFSLARGYALSLSFFIITIYFAFKIINLTKPNPIDFRNLIIAGVLALSSNYTVFFQFSAVVFFTTIWIIIQSKSLKTLLQKEYLVPLIIFVLATLITLTNLFLIKYLSNDLQYGGDISFISNTLSSIINFTLYQPVCEYQNISTLKHASILLLILLSAISLFGIVTKNIKINFFTFLFFTQFFLNYLTFFIFKTPFPLDRTALIILPSIVFSIVFFVDALKIKPLAITMFSTILLIIASLNMNRAFTLRTSLEWHQQSEVLEALDLVNKIKKETRTSESKIVFSPDVNAVWVNYYQHFYPEKYSFDTILAITNSYQIPGKEDLRPNYILSTGNINVPKNLTNRVILIKEFKRSGIKVYTIKD